MIKTYEFKVYAYKSIQLYRGARCGWCGRREKEVWNITINDPNSDDILVCILTLCDKCFDTIRKFITIDRDALVESIEGDEHD